jgi:L-iditol 2-dehydrogenase
MSVMLALQSEGIASTFVTDKIDKRLSIAKSQGASWTGNPLKTDVVNDISNKEPLLLDVVFECCGQQDAMDNAIDLLKPGGKLIIIGIPEFDRWSMSADKIRRKELVFQNIRRQLNCVQPAIDLIKNKKVDVSAMITHQFPFNQTQKAFDLVSGYQDGVMKAMIHFG